ncbi:hypothetical protein SAPIO_CDS3961 [Scedosporium apiospermum]|uniref:PUM-HD domain-containing protein n=1 Tax=Pseudallescheria apiosperma TaxID=563466 RepID=A0A084G8Z7_PSEDA|nr:uncharacterized protein SAPIO_CDS3961 [Scedosporium apiospermum]KEZ43809.1 hypothetical protein SAPIO_CDS3961 [Scedosporium apiospermum]
MSSAPSPNSLTSMGHTAEKGIKPSYPTMLGANDTGSGLYKTGGRPIPLLSTGPPHQGGVKVTNNQENIPTFEPSPMELLLSKLDEQRETLHQQKLTVIKNKDHDKIFVRPGDHRSSSTSVPVTPALEDFPSSEPATRPASASLSQGPSGNDEVLRLRMQLAQAEAKISQLERQPSMPRMSQAVSDYPAGLPQAFGPPFGPIVAAAMPAPGHNGGWSQDEYKPSPNEHLATIQINRAPSVSMWAGNLKTPAVGIAGPSGGSSDASSGSAWFPHKPGFAPSFVEANNGAYGPMENFRVSERVTPDPDFALRVDVGGRGGRFDNRYISPAPLSAPPYGGGFNLNQNIGQYELTSGPANGPGNNGPGPGTIGMGVYPSYHQQVANALSPHATEFTSSGGSWKSEISPTEGPTYLPPTEPLNYRRLLDRNVNCNWKYIVDKIVCNNDQQASIFLQQKLKVGTPEQKYEIVEAIVSQAYPLMVNRFGNFLVQRCFEHGTDEQVVKIAEAIRGNTLNLSMDPFGCHVVQKAFDSVPEDYKKVMVHELLRRIPETVIHRYACHVWQKLFELRWTDTPPQIMKYVNDALKGMWHEVALGETGSLVVQNIFENCLEDDKRPCIEEVLANIDIVAHGQFGNWCIQHICEHGAPADRSRAIDHVIRYASEYSTDQFASKVVEKCLKIGGPEFLGRYLDRVCEGRPDRPRIPLIDIASDQYGNYLVQYILTHAGPQHREVVAAHIRKHMVSLRGSKFGSRVGMLCTNPASATRPGPAMGPGMGGGGGGGGRMHPGSRFGGPSYR